MTFTETPLGFELTLPSAQFFFGKREASLEALQNGFPGLRWARLRQTHSPIVLQATADGRPEGDAHWTREQGLALPIVTADCTPVLLFDGKNGLIASVHAGWRGVASRIVPATLATLIERGASVSSLHAFIGPHIQKTSFEVDGDVKDQLFSSTLATPSAVQALGGEKFLVDLQTLLRRQLAEFGVTTERTIALPFDTKCDLRFHSFRRDRERSGRQLSFAVLK